MFVEQKSPAAALQRPLCVSQVVVFSGKTSGSSGLARSHGWSGRLSMGFDGGDGDEGGDGGGNGDGGGDAGMSGGLGGRSSQMEWQNEGQKAANVLLAWRRSSLANSTCASGAPGSGPSRRYRWGAYVVPQKACSTAAVASLVGPCLASHA